MASTLGPILTNIFVGFNEKLLFNRFPRPYIHFRYVGDTFACFSSRNETLSLFHCLNDLYPSLTFTKNDEKDYKLPFLDALVELLSFAFGTCIYRKPTFAGLYLSWYAFASTSRKVNWIKCLTFRALKNCSDNKIKSKFEQIKIHFWVTGILRKSLLTPLTIVFISLGITSSYLALLNAQFMLDFLGLDLLASWLPIRFLPRLPAFIMWLWFEPSLLLVQYYALFIRMCSSSSNKAI